MSTWALSSEEERLSDAEEVAGSSPAAPTTKAILLFQGIFYGVTGLWPFLHLDSFVAVVGPKPDVFQLHVTSGLIIVIAGALIVGAQRPEPSTVILGIASALTFVVLDVAYARTLRDVYWLDAVVEAAIALTLMFLALRRKS